MIPIEETKRVDWNAIRAEYIGGASYGDLSKKYHLSKSTIYQHAKQDNWQTLRTNAANESRTKAIQKTADAAADNAIIATAIKKSLLLRLQRIERKYPFDATEVRTKQGSNYVVFRLRDLTAAYKDLTEDMPKEADTTTLDKLDALLQEAWDAAHR